MPIFEFVATDQEGKPVRGTHVGRSLDTVAGELGQRGLSIQSLSLATDSAFMDQPTSTERAQVDSSRGVTGDISSQRSWAAAELFGPLVGRVSLDQQSFFYRQYAVMIGAGVSPVQALDTLAGQASNKKLSNILRELRQHALEGRPISFGMQRYPEVFSPLMLSLVRVGEKSGMLEQTFDQMATYCEREIAIRNLVKKVTFYPKLVVGASVVILTAANMIIASVAPQGKRIEMPLTNPKVLIILIPLIIAIFLFSRVGLANFRLKYMWDRFILSVPYIGKTVKQFSMAKFGRALAALYQAGVPVQDAFRLSADACDNEYLRARMMPVFRNLEAGHGMSETLRATNAFSPIVLDMVATGEQTGNLDRMLDKMSDYYEGEAEVRAIKLGWVFGVVCLFVVAVYIGYVYITNMINIVGGGYQQAIEETGK
jgi:MSHA biogenesis protein MshG